MILSNLHKQPTALDTIAHRDLRLDVNPSLAPKIADKTSFLITLGEFAEAAREFPILFVRGAPEDGRDTVVPVVVFGLQEGENLFVRDGLWTASYLPALLRVYPFTMARLEGSDRWAVVFDAEWPGIGRDHGERLFNDDGAATPLLEQIHAFLRQIEADQDRTRQVCTQLQDLKLLKPMRFDATLANGEKLSIDGFMTVDEEALARLSDEQVVTYWRSGLLNVLHTHLLSLPNMRRLLDRRFQPPAAAAAGQG